MRHIVYRAQEPFIISSGEDQHNIMHSPRVGGGGLILGIIGRGVPPGSPNPDPISDQKMPFSTPVFSQPYL